MAAVQAVKIDAHGLDKPIEVWVFLFDIPLVPTYNYGIWANSSTFRPNLLYKPPKNFTNDP